MRLVLAALLALIGGAASAQSVPDQTPESLVRFIYEQYVGKKSDDPTTFRWSTSPMAERLFEPALARAVIKAAESDEPVIDADPFVEAQDFDIPSYALTTGAKTADKARVTARFSNMGRATTVNYDLVRTKAGWRIHDVWSRSPREGLRRTVKLR